MPAPPPPSPSDASIVPADRGPDPAGRFPAGERAIFAYGLGGLRGDPLAIERRFLAATAGMNRGAVGGWLDSPHATTRLLGLGRLLPALQAAFDLPPFAEGDASGFTAAEVFALQERFLAFTAATTSRWRTESEFIATYGPDPDVPRSYERHVGLWWNRGRAQALAAVAAWRGAVAASGRAPIHFSLVDAISSSVEDAEELAEDLENDRAEAAALAASAAARGRNPS